MAGRGREEVRQRAGQGAPWESRGLIVAEGSGVMEKWTLGLTRRGSQTSDHSGVAQSVVIINNML